LLSITAEHITKNYLNGKAEITALKDISLQVKQGELFGLIGPDGAGKTSLLRILTTLILPDKGTASVQGFDVVKDYKQIRQLTGYMPGRFSLYHDLSVQENLNFFATIFNTSLQENYHLIKDIYDQIAPFKHRKAGKLSGGMKQKLALCCALIHKPAVLFLDEPTTGVDAVSRKEFWHMLQGLKTAGITILVSTPYMDEASLCDRVALMQEGRFLEIDTPQRIITNHQKQLWAAKSNQMFQLLQHLRQYEPIESVYPFGEYYHVTPKTYWQNADSMLHYLQQHQHTGIDIKSIAPNIEDIFMHLMNQPHD
jgi:ABC-type multidrug transport system ATPase subunit